MSWRMAAVWALIGFAAQCSVSLIRGDSFESALAAALLLYILFGGAGHIVGGIIQRSAERRFDAKNKATEDAAARVESEAESSGESTETDDAASGASGS